MDHIQIPDQLRLKLQRNINGKNDIETYSTYLQKYLCRPLTRKEEYMLYSISTENYNNYQLNRLQDMCEERGLYIPHLTDHDGDCLFASLTYHGICHNIEDFRKGLAVLLYLFKDTPNLLPNVEITLADMFAIGNDIKYVKQSQIDQETGYPKEDEEIKCYKYDFNIMCHDLANCGSWARLPMELILRVISWYFNIKIMIIRETSDLIIDNVSNSETSTMIFLGHLGETHYVPVAVNMNEDDQLWERLQYDRAWKRFCKWAQRVEQDQIHQYQQFVIDQSRIQQFGMNQPAQNMNDDPEIIFNN